MLLLIRRRFKKSDSFDSPAFPDPQRRFMMTKEHTRLLLLPLSGLVRGLNQFGRFASLIVGFMVMVAGGAVLASPIMVLGFPVFGFGLFLTLRSLQ